MADEQFWRVTRDDSEDLGFALDCLTAGAVTLDEFKSWIYLVLEQSDEFPDFLIDLIDVEQKHELISGWRDLIGFWPESPLSSREEKAPTGIAHARFEGFRHDTVRRDAAINALGEADELRMRFARSFPTISIPDEDPTADESAQDRRVSSWWLRGAEDRPLAISEIQTLFINRMAAGQLTMILDSDTGASLRVATDRTRVRIDLTGPGDAAGHAIDADAEGTSHGYVLDDGQDAEYSDRDTVTIPTALAVIDAILAQGTAPQHDWQIDVSR